MNILEKKKEKFWLLKPFSCEIGENEIQEISAKLNIHPVVTKLLYARGYTTAKEMDTFLSMESERLCNPFDMVDMEKGVLRIAKAIQNTELITIYGDYDVDGVTSVATLYLYLKALGANVSYYIPNRTTDGYGVTTAALDMLKESGTSLIITVDTGITASAEVEYAKTLGIDFVVTDHHECHGEIPDAVAVINPHRPDCPYPFKELAGVGVVFKLLCAYEERRSGKSRLYAATRIFEEFSDLVAIGTIADVMPIHEENRIIVSYGLRMIDTKRRIGISALMEAASAQRNENIRSDKRKKQIKVTSGYIGFTLAPRINAAGRIRSATRAVELFLTDNYEEAYLIAQELCDANKDRQNEENQIIRDAFDKIEAHGDLDEYPVIVLDADNWHHGVIGIVASRITEKYCRPSILVSFEGGMGKVPSDDDIGKGSGRSIKGLNLVEALANCQETLVKFGGHELAAGLSVTRGNLPLFREMINKFARENLQKDGLIPTIEADLEISFSDLSIELAQYLSILEPYGVGNPIPNFIIRGVTINEIVPISQGKHTRLSLGDGRVSYTGMFFSVSPESLDLNVGDSADVLFNVDINEFNGRRSLQLIIKDIRLSETEQQKRKSEEDRFAEIWSGMPFSSEENILPSREDFAALYKLILLLKHQNISTVSHRDLINKLSVFSPHMNINYIKLKVMIKVMIEMNIIGIEEEGEVYTFTVRYSTTKTDLERSGLLRRLRLQQKN